jgi:hypothetical protein
MDRTLCDSLPVQVHVIVPPTAIVSTAGFAVPLCALRKRTLDPTLTVPTGPPPPPSPGDAGP